MVYSLGEKVVTKKKHPCGSDVWTIVRTGADFKLRCDKCGRIVMMSNAEFLKAVKRKAVCDERTDKL